MVGDISVGGTFLHEFLASGKEQTADPSSGVPLASAIRDAWAKAVGGGAPGLFVRRLEAEGMSEEEALVRLARGVARFSAKEPPWFALLRRAVGEGAKGGDLPSFLAAYVGTGSRRLWAVPLFAAPVGDSLVRQMENQVRQLLKLIGAQNERDAWELFANRPLVARLLAERTRQWLRVCQRLVRRLQQDQSLLEERFLAGKSLEITDVELGLSDRHRDGETVARLRTTAGITFYYKPRSLEPERVLGLFLDALRKMGLRLEPLPPMVVRRDYGWVGEVAQARLSNREQVRQWFSHAGHLVVAAWLLGLSDLHWENVVAGEGGPVIVDGETWCRPMTFLDRQGEMSLLSSGLVTFPADGPVGFRDDGALLGGGRPEARSLPLFGSGSVDPRRFRDEVIEGAREAFSLLARARESGLQLPVHELARLRIRWVARPSEAYASFLTFLLQNPKVRFSWQASVLAETRWRGLLGSGLDATRFLPWLQEETKALQQFTIPRLTLPAGRRNGVVRRSGREAILKRLQHLHEEFAKEQVTILGDALPYPKTRARNELRDAAARVAAVLREEGIDRSEPGPFLRRGQAGNALAWAAWARVSGDPQGRAQALRCLKHVRGWVDDGTLEKELVGFGTGLGGLVYALWACGCWLEEPALQCEARELATQLLKNEGLPEHLDVEAGLAGLLLGTGESVRGVQDLEKALEVKARQCIEAVENARCNGHRAIWAPGFAHGISGVAAALIGVGLATGKQGFLRKAVEFLLQEPRAGSWFAQAELATGGQLPVKMNGWCHGPAGAWLARQLVPRELRTAELGRQSSQAASLVFPLTFSGPLSLCCGILARSEISLSVGELGEDGRRMGDSKKLAALVFNSGLWRRELDPKGGLLDGLPGFLFHICRVLAPEQVGSVLVARTVGGPQWK